MTKTQLKNDGWEITDSNIDYCWALKKFDTFNLKIGLSLIDHRLTEWYAYVVIITNTEFDSEMVTHHFNKSTIDSVSKLVDDINVFMTSYTKFLHTIGD